MTVKQARLRRLVPLREARPDVPAHVLYHAGPPYRGQPPKAVAIAAAQAAVIGGLAGDIAEAERLIGKGTLSLAPAQDHGIVVPLSMVLAPAMWCYEVGDDAVQVYAPVSEGPPPALRFGSADPGCVTRARDWCAEAAAILNPRLPDLPAVEALMQTALQQGDDCHAITAAGNTLFVNALAALPDTMKAALLGNPGFVLGIWMAWAAWKLQTSGSTIAAVGGNGIDAGLRRRGGTRWRTIPAVPPSGRFLRHDRAAYALGAIGDSAVVDICGYGGQATHHVAALVQEWAQVLPPNLKERCERIVNPATGIVDPAQVAESGFGPVINLGILDRDGAGGPIGRGVYIIPPALFSAGD